MKTYFINCLLIITQKMINKLIEIGVNPLDQDSNGNEIF